MPEEQPSAMPPDPTDGISDELGDEISDEQGTAAPDETPAEMTDDPQHPIHRDAPHTDADLAPDDEPGDAPIAMPVAANAPAPVAVTMPAPPASAAYAVYTPSSHAPAAAHPIYTTPAIEPASLDGAGLPRPIIPRPKPVIVPERDGNAFRTANIRVERCAGRSFYITYTPPGRAPQRVYIPNAAMDGMLDLVAAPNLEPGLLWRRFSDLPLERPLPSRALEEELRLLLVAFSAEIRRS